MKKFFFLFFALCAISAWGQESLKLPPSPEPVRANPPVLKPDFPALRLQGGRIPPLFELSDFSGGLNTRSRVDNLAPNEAAILTNFLLSSDGQLTVRPGMAKVNASLIRLSSIWGLYHYSIPNYGKGFLVGDSVYIYKMTDAGTFADSQIYSPIIIRIASGSNIGTVIEPQDKWLLEKTIFKNDEVLLKSGAALETLIVKFLVWNNDSSRYQIHFTDNADRTISTSTDRSYARLRVPSASNAAIIQRNNTVVLAPGSHQAVYWNGFIKQAVGFYSEGTIDTIKGLAGRGRDTLIVCNSCSLSTNELRGKIFVAAAKNEVASPDSLFRKATRLITGNTVTNIYWQEMDTNQYSLHVTGVPFTIWSPVFTVIDSGTVDSVYQGTGSSAGTTYIRDLGASFSDDDASGSRILEFLTGPARGILKVTRQNALNSTTIGFYKRDGKNFSDNDKPRPGDRYAIYDIGLSARYLELYYDRLVAAGLDFFPNTIIYSVASDINNFMPGTDFLTLPEQGGDSIVAIVNFNGALRVLQKQRLWTLLGSPPWTGSTVILATDGIGCIAPRSVVQDGNYLYFVGLFGDIPTVFRWDGGGVKFSTTGGSALFEGEGHLVRLTAKIDPTMKTIPKSKLQKATSAIYGENLFVSTVLSGDTVNDATIAINLRTGAISVQSFEAGLFHNGRAAGDSGQVYFTSVSDSGWVYQFGKDSSDLGVAIVPIYESGWLDFGNSTLYKQGYRLWSRFARANTTGTGTWSTRWDFSGSDATSFNVSTTSGERDENTYLGVGAYGKRVKFRFIANPGVNATFRVGGIKFKFALRGEAL